MLLNGTDELLKIKREIKHCLYERFSLKEIFEYWFYSVKYSYQLITEDWYKYGKREESPRLTFS